MIPYQQFGMFFLASNGGRGSFGFADTSVFGDRQLRSSDPKAVTDASNIPQDVVAGGGGGAKANHQLPFGSHALGYSPNGVVLIRLTRIE